MSNALNRLHDLGQSIWLDNIRRELLTSGTLARWVETLSVTGLTSNPTIFEQAISHGTDYDDAIRRHATAGRTPRDVFFAIALEDITAAADVSGYATGAVMDSWDAVTDGFINKARAFPTAWGIEGAQPQRKRAGADSLAGVLQLGEPARAFGEVVDDQNGPLRPDDLGARGDRALTRLVDREHRPFEVGCRHRTRSIRIGGVVVTPPTG